jgi:hypothetical protein
MYLTLAEMRADLMGSVPGFAPSTYNTVIQKAYDNTIKSFPWQDLELEVNIATVKHISQGGVHFANGATDVTAGSTVSAAWSDGESDGFAGMFISKTDEAAYFKIANSTSAELTLTSNYIGKTTTAAASAGDGYSLFKHLLEVPTAMDTVTHVIFKDKPLGDATEEYIEARDPDFWEYGEPERWRRAGYDSANATIIQIYPAACDDVYALRLRGKKRIETLADSTTPLLDSSLIVAIAEIELLKRKKIMTPDSVTQDMMDAVISNASNLYDSSIEKDRRSRTEDNHVKDGMFGTNNHPGQRRLVSYDPWFI